MRRGCVGRCRVTNEENGTGGAVRALDRPVSIQSQHAPGEDARSDRCNGVPEVSVASRRSAQDRKILRDGSARDLILPRRRAESLRLERQHLHQNHVVAIDLLVTDQPIAVTVGFINLFLGH